VEISEKNKMCCKNLGLNQREALNPKISSIALIRMVVLLYHKLLTKHKIMDIKNK